MQLLKFIFTEHLPLLYHPIPTLKLFYRLQPQQKLARFFLPSLPLYLEIGIGQERTLLIINLYSLTRRAHYLPNCNSKEVTYTSDTVLTYRNQNTAFWDFQEVCFSAPRFNFCILPWKQQLPDLERRLTGKRKNKINKNPN